MTKVSQSKQYRGLFRNSIVEKALVGILIIPWLFFLWVSHNHPSSSTINRRTSSNSIRRVQDIHSIVDGSNVQVKQVSNPVLAEEAFVQSFADPEHEDGFAESDFELSESGDELDEELNEEDDDDLYADTEILEEEEEEEEDHSGDNTDGEEVVKSIQ